MQLPDIIKNAVEALTKLPGVGEKTAFRMVMSMTRWRGSELQQVGEALIDLQELSFCKECGVFCNDDMCDICSSDNRKSERSLCVVESVSDLMAIERSAQFKGIYHILGGVLNPLLGVGPEQLRLDDFEEKIKRFEIAEIILAVNPSVEGDATCAYIRSLIDESVRVERIGFGVPIGGSLEYLDSMTISKSLENRKKF